MSGTTAPPPLWVRVLLGLYPPAFRRRYRLELWASTTAILRERGRRSRGRLLWDLLAGAGLEWLDLLLNIALPTESLLMRLDHLFRELRFAVRRLIRSPGFAAITILTVALAIGANTAVFTLVNGVLLRPMPYEEPSELGFVWSGIDWIGIPRAWMAGPHVPFLREHADRFEDFAALRAVRIDMATSPEEPGTRVMTGLVTGNLFDVLGVEALVGRTLHADEEGPGAPSVAVLTHSLWVEAFGSDPAVVGQNTWLEGSPYRVVGVMPEGFRFSIHSSLGDPRTPDLYIPLDHDLPALSVGNHSYAVIGRLVAGARWPEAAAQLDALGAQFGGEHYGDDRFRFRVVALHSDLVKEVRPALWMLMGAVALVLAIACSNVATLVYGRALTAQRELAVRGALGASGWSRLGPLLLESGLVAAAGGLLGIPLAYAATGGLLSLAPAELPRTDAVAPDWRVMAFSLGLSAGVALALAAVPTFRQRRADLTESLRDGGRAGSARYGGHRALVVVQVTLSGILLVGAGLMARSLLELSAVDPGFATRDVRLADVRIPGYLYELDVEALAVFERIRSQAAAAAGVGAVGWTSSAPLSADTNQRPFGFDLSAAATGDPAQDRVTTDTFSASPGYFAAAGVEIVQGRGFEPTDDAEGELVMVIDESLAERFWPDGAVGGEIRIDPDDPTTARVVGVVRQPRLYDIRQDDRYQIYRPLAQAPQRTLTLVARPGPGVRASAVDLAAIVHGVDRAVSVTAVRSIEDVVGDALSSWRFMLQLLGLFAGAALALAMLGLYGVVSLSVARQSRAIGIRMALGARAAEVGRGVVGQGLRLASVGLVGALLGASLLGELLRRFLYGVAPLDPISLGAVAILLTAVAAAASWLPARRAAKISPVEAFRTE